MTCPTLRIHPAVIAQAAATSAVLLEGRFSIGVGSGEALNEHILGTRWPEADERLEMLEEAIEVIRLLWQGGVQSHRGRHYRVENARVYDLPDEPPRIQVSGFGPKATSLAARVGDGYATTSPDKDLIGRYRREDGKGPIHAGAKVCFGPDRDEAVKTVHRLWPNIGLPGELAQLSPRRRTSSRPAGSSPRTRSPRPCRAAPNSITTSSSSRPSPTPVSTSSTSSRSAPAPPRSSRPGRRTSSSAWPASSRCCCRSHRRRWTRASPRRSCRRTARRAR